MQDEENTPGKKRKKIRKIIKDKKLSQEVKDAVKAEEERRKRIEDNQKMVLHYYQTDLQFVYSSPPLIRPPYLPGNCGHIREVAFGDAIIEAAPKICGNIREGGL